MKGLEVEPMTNFIVKDYSIKPEIMLLPVA